MNRTPTLTEDDILAISVALKELKNGTVYVADFFTKLPAAQTNLGRLYYITYERTLYQAKAITTSGGSLAYLWVKLTNDNLSSVWMWGSNSNNQLGTNSATTVFSPVPISALQMNWCFAIAGSFHTAALKTDGTLWTWGWNGCGQLGDGTQTQRAIPVQTAAGGTNWKQVCPSREHTVAVKTDGTLWVWGNGICGRLGDGAILMRTSPITTAGGGTNWCQVALGCLHTAAIKTDGTLWTWGHNLCGRLGDGAVIDKCSPETTAGGGTNWCQVSGGNDHTAAVKTDGTLWTWGLGTFGRLGDNTLTNKCSPDTTIGGGNDWCVVKSGFAHTVALKTNGTIWSWGCNNVGQLGDNTVTSRLSPVTTAGGGTNWCQIAAGDVHTMALKTDGTLWTWGWNCCGRLATNTQTNRSSPGTTVIGGNNWVQVGVSGVGSNSGHGAAIRVITQEI